MTHFTNDADPLGHAENDTSLIQKIHYLMTNDDDDQSERLVDTYEQSGPKEKQAIDDVFVCLCGYSLKTILAGDAN